MAGTTTKLGEKTSKVTALAPQEFNNLHQQDNYGNWKFIVTMENGDVGTVGTKDKEGAAFAVGNTVTYDLNKWESDDKTKSSFFIKLPKAPYKGGGTGKYPKSLTEFKAEAVLVAAKLAADTIHVTEGKTIQANFKSIFQYFVKEIQAELSSTYTEQ